MHPQHKPTGLTSGLTTLFFSLVLCGTMYAQEPARGTFIPPSEETIAEPEIQYPVKPVLRKGRSGLVEDSASRLWITPDMGLTHQLVAPVPEADCTLKFLGTEEDPALFAACPGMYQWTGIEWYPVTEVPEYEVGSGRIGNAALQSREMESQFGMRVPQAATTAACYEVTTPSSNLSRDYQRVSIRVKKLRSNCQAWSATRTVDWLVFTNGTSGNVTADLQVNVLANTGVQARSGAIQIQADRSYSIGFTQAGTPPPPAPCVFAVSPLRRDLGASSQQLDFYVTVTQKGTTKCNFRVSENASWITLTSGQSGTTSTRVTALVTFNSQRLRTDYIYVDTNNGRIPVMVNQAGVIK